jgi:hypothetical protein
MAVRQDVSRGARLIARRRRRRAEEDAQRVSRRPIGDLTDVQAIAGVGLSLSVDGNLEIDLVTPTLRTRTDRKRLVERFRGRRAIQLVDELEVAGAYLDRLGAITHGVAVDSNNCGKRPASTWRHTATLGRS